MSVHVCACPCLCFVCGGCRSCAFLFTSCRDMAGSTYTYCYEGCPLPWLANNTNLGVWGGVVGVDHYYTNQGMPCM